MRPEYSWTERRHHVRVNARGTAYVHSELNAMRGRVVSVSPTSLEIKGGLGVVLSGFEGVAVEVELWLDVPEPTPFVVHGRVTRIRTADHTLVIGLGELPEPLARSIALHAGDHGPVEVMVIDSVADRRGRVADAFRAQACHVVETATAREALDALTAAPRSKDVIVVADTSPADVADDLRGYLDLAYADAVIVGVRDWEWFRVTGRVDPLREAAVLRACVEAVLRSVRREAPRTS